MFAAALALAVSATGSAPAAVGVSGPPALQGQLGPVLPANAPVHLGISLRAPSIDAMRSLAAAQQDPSSPNFRAWLTPAQFGRSFGLSETDYGRVQGWLVSSGFRVTAYEDRLFIEGFGTHTALQQLLGVQLYALTGADGHVYRTYQGSAQAPGDVASLVLNISGIDTQPRFRPLLLDSQGDQTFGPQDLRRFYDLQPLLDLGYTGRNAQLVVLGVATDNAHVPRSQDIQYFFDNYADTQAKFETRTLPNPNEDVDATAAARTEMELDVEVQVVGAPGAASITLELPPASEQLSTGAHDVALLSNITAVSTSFGTCEAASSQVEAQAVEQIVLLGTLGGQTWVAAAGDQGTDGCGLGLAPEVDLPADVPEMVAAGGTAVRTATFDTNNAIARYEPEEAWNQASVGAGGGGRSALFAKPSWQLATTPSDQSRDLPDLALLAATVPGVAVDAQQPARVIPMGGTSVAAPLAAGMVALLGDRLGCRLGGINPILYGVGLAQFDGGIVAFHDIVNGNNGFNGVPGQSATVGYDLATGWGSVDVVALAAAFPACAPDAGIGDAGPLVPYDSCSAISCPPGSTCETDPEGPSYCYTPCDPSDLASCGSGSVCVSADAGGYCAPGCQTDGDCGSGDSCDSCSQSCVPTGNATAHVGDGCQADSDCPTGGTCVTDGTFAQGYCTRFCDACGCPSGAVCVALNLEVCLAQCQTSADCRSGYVCQPLAADAGAAGVCLPHCQTDADCTGLDPGTSCELSDGVCVTAQPADGGAGMSHGATGGLTGGTPPHMGADGGTGGGGTGGDKDAGSPGGLATSSSGGTSGGVSELSQHGGGCSQGGGLGWSGALLALGVLVRRRRRSA